MKNIKNYVIGFAIGFIGIVILWGIFSYASSITATLPKDFVSSKKTAAQKLYDNLNNIDFVNDYPSTPEEVMDVYCDTVFMLYGNMIENDDIFTEILGIQRQLYSDELLEKNPFETQYNSFIESKDKIYSHNATTAQMDHDNTFYSKKDENSCIIQVKQHVNKIGVVHWNYYLNKIDNKWKINTWEMTDENFKPIEQ